MNFQDIKRKVIADLLASNYSIEARQDVDEKNLLAVGKISPGELAQILKQCRGQEHSSSPHHKDKNVDMHIIITKSWYVKFHFYSGSTFISVHKENKGKVLK